MDAVHDPGRVGCPGRAPAGARPGGTFHFTEHGLAPDADVQRWQRRLDPVQQRLVGGCHLTRPIAGLIADAGFLVAELDTFYEKGAPKALAATSLGVARTPDA